MGRTTLEALFERYLGTRDERALEEIVGRTRGRLRAIARRIVDGHDAEDCVQTAYLSLIHKRAGEMRAPVLPWLVTAVVRIAYGHRARAARMASLAARLAHGPEDPGPVARAVEAEEARRLHAIVDRLPARYRDPVVLHYFHGSSVREVATLVGASENAVKKRLERARRMLRGRWSAVGRAVPVPVLLWLREAGALVLTGGLIPMKKAILATVVLLALATGTWLGVRAFPRDDQAVARIGATRSSALEAPARARVPAGAWLPDAPEPVAPAGVDLDRDLHGIVSNPAGIGIPHARLMLLGRPWAGLGGGSAASPEEVVGTTVSARDGTFALRLTRGAWGELCVDAEGYAPARLGFRSAGERVTVVLSPARAYAVRVRDERGHPVEGAHVAMSATGEGGAWYSEERESDAEGRARFERGPRCAALWIEARLGARACRERRVPDPAGAFPSEFELVLREGRVVLGRVTDAATGVPIAGARVLADGERAACATTDSDGRFRLEGLGESPRQGVLIEADDYPGRWFAVPAGDSMEVALARGSGARGRAVDAGGTPIPGTRVAAIAIWARSPFTPPVRSVRHAVTGPDGTFDLRGLEPRLAYRLVLAREGLGRVARTFAPLLPDEGPLDLGAIVLGGGRFVEGVVLDPRGLPAARIAVDLLDVDAARETTNEAGERVPVTGGDGQSRVTDHLGRFRFHDLAPATYELHARTPGSGEAALRVVLGEADLRDVVVRLAPGREFLVTLVDDAQVPIAGATVTVRSDRGQLEASTDASGRARFFVEGRIRSVAADSVSTLHALPSEGPAYLPPPPVRDPPESEAAVELVAACGVRVEARVIGPDGTPMAGANVGLGDDELRLYVSDESGVVRLVLPPGRPVRVRYRGRPDAGGALPGAQQRFVGDWPELWPKDSPWTLRLREVLHDRVVRVLVVGPDGAPVADASAIWHTGNGAARPVRAGDDGRAVLQGVPRDGVLVQAAPPPGRERGLAPSAEVSVSPEGGEVRLRLRATAPLAGLVLDENGTPIPGCEVTVRAGVFTLPDCVSDAQGRFEVRVPVPWGGPVSLRVYRRSATDPRLANLRLDGPPDGDVVVRLEGSG